MSKKIPEESKKAVLEYLNSGNKPVEETKNKNIWGQIFGLLVIAGKAYLRYNDMRS